MELLDIVDENNNLTGEILEREIVHAQGLWHREVGVIVLNEKGKLLIEDYTIQIEELSEVKYFFKRYNKKSFERK